LGAKMMRYEAAQSGWLTDYQDFNQNFCKWPTGCLKDLQCRLVSWFENWFDSRPLIPRTLQNSMMFLKASTIRVHLILMVYSHRLF
jgi:hypothetical protein